MIVLTSLVTIVNAQEQEMKYLFGGKGKTKVSGFMAPIMEYSAIGNEFAFFMGGGAAILLNQTFFFGGYGEGLTTMHDSKYSDPLKYFIYPTGQIEFGHGGFWLGYIYKSTKPVHFGFSSKLGWGLIDLKDYPNYYPIKEDIFRDNVFVAIPQVEIEINFFRWLKMNVGVGYRFVTGIDKPYLYTEELIYDKKDFNKPEATMTLMFGFFK